MVTTISSSPEETRAAGRRLAGELRGGEILALVGELGAGKTEFSRGLAEALGVRPEAVTSPTFTLVQTYRGENLRLHHIDFYRLERAAEAAALGLEELWGDDAIVLIEWADRFPDILPAEGIVWIEIEAPRAGRRDERVIRRHTSCPRAARSAGQDERNGGEP